MKKSIIIGMALLSLGVLSCTREQEAPVQKPAEAGVVTLGAVLDKTTKAAISDDAKFTWQSGDAISVITTSGLVDFELTDGEGQSTASFSGTVEGGEAALGSYAIYPAGNHSITAEGVTVNLPSEYAFLEDNTNIPLVGSISDNTVTFKAVGGVARIKAGIPAGAVKAVLSTDKKITGDFAVEDDVITAGADKDAVTYTFTKVEAKTNMTFNFPLPAGEYTMHFAIYDEEGTVLAELAGSAPHTIKAADVLIFDELAFPEMRVKLNDTQEFETIQDAVNVAATLEGAATITLAEGEYDENVILNAVPVPVVIDGIDATKAVVTSFEVMATELTLQNITIKPGADDYKPSLEEVPGGYNWPYGVYVYRAGYGFIADHVILDMSAANGNATGFFFINNGDKGSKRDAIRNSTLGDSAADYSKRNAQIYGEPIDIEGNIISGGHRDYGIRIGYAGVDAVIKNNSFFNSNPTNHSSGKGYGIDFLNISGSKIVLEGNTCDDSFVSLYGASDQDVTNPDLDNTFVPELIYDGGKLLEKPVTLKDFAEEFVKGLEVWENTVGNVDADGTHTHTNGTAWENVHFIPIRHSHSAYGNEGNQYDPIYDIWTLNLAGREVSSANAWEIAIRGLLNLVTEGGEAFLDTVTDRNDAYTLADNGKLSDPMPTVDASHDWGLNPWYEYDNTVLDNGEEINEVGVEFMVKVGIWHVVRSFIDNRTYGGSNNPLGAIGNFQEFGTTAGTLNLGNYVGYIAPMRELLVMMRIYKYLLDNSIEENVYTALKDQKFDFDLYGLSLEPGFAIDGDFSEWDTVEAIEGTGAIKALKVYPTEDQYFFYLQADKTALISDNYAFANYLTMCFDNGDKTGEKSTTRWNNAKYDKHIQLWLMQKGQPKMVTWSMTNFAHAEAVTGDVVEYEFCCDRSTHEVFSGKTLRLGVYLNGQTVDTSSGSEVWGGDSSDCGAAPAIDKKMAIIGEQPETAVKLNGEGYDTIQEAVNAAAELTAGEALITLTEGAEFTEEVKITGYDADAAVAPAVKVPVVIDGVSTSTVLNGSFEIKGAKVTVKNLTVNPTATSITAMAGDGYRTNAGYPFAFEIVTSGYGCVIDNTVINVAPMLAKDSGLLPTAIYIGYKVDGADEWDVISNNVVNWTGQRDAQIFSAKVKLLNNTFNGGLYARLHGSGANYVLSGNTFNGCEKSFVLRSDLENAKLFFGKDGVNDDNVYNGVIPTMELDLTTNALVPGVVDGAIKNPDAEGLPLTRVWAKWDKFDWDIDILPQTIGNNWDRNAVAVGQYLYIPIAQAALANSGIAVIDVLTGELVTIIKSGLIDAGHFKVCGAAKLGDAVYVSSMGMQSNSTHLIIYKLTSLSGGHYTAAEVALDYTIEDASARLGDVMTGWGTDTEGILCFVDYNQPNEQRRSYMFQVKNGAITNGDAPYMPLYMNTTSGKSYMLGLNIFSGPTTVEGGHYALLSGNSPDVVRGVSKWNTDGWYNQQIGDKYAEYSSAEIGIFKHNMNDPVQMVIGGKQYLTYVSGSSPQGTLRLVDITGEDGLLTRIMNLGSAENVESQSTIYPLAVPGDAAGSGRRGHNGTGFLTTTEISGVTYVLAGVTEAGISCFKVD